MCRCVLVCCTVYRFMSASFPNPSTAPAPPHRAAPQRRLLAVHPHRRGPRRTQDHRWPKGRERQARSMLTTRYLRSRARAACHLARRSWRKSLRGRTIARLSASNRSAKPWKNCRSASSPQPSSDIASVSPLSHQRSCCPPDRPAEGAGQTRNPSTRLAYRPYRSDTTGLISAICP